MVMSVGSDNYCETFMVILNFWRILNIYVLLIQYFWSGWRKQHWLIFRGTCVLENYSCQIFKGRALITYIRRLLGHQRWFHRYQKLPRCRKNHTQNNLAAENVRGKCMRFSANDVRRHFVRILSLPNSSTVHRCKNLMLWWNAKTN
jgi:hypothetical protein